MTTPALPRGLLVEQKILERLRTIKRSAGFFTDMGDNADLGPIHRPNADVSVAVEFVDERPQGSTGNPQVHDKHLILRAFKIRAQIKFKDEDTPRGELMNKALADIKRAVFNMVPFVPTDAKTLGWPTYTGAQLEPRVDGNQYEAVSATGTTTYTEAIGEPENAD
jgi:hypothetical protein